MMLTLGSTLLILLIVFGALVAASVPLILAVTAVFGTGGLVAIASQLMPIDDVAQAAIMLIGLAVGVDYSLFYIRRQREERAKGHSTLDAIDIAAATSGRAVLLSGLTVMAAMAGMLLTGNSIFMSMGVSTILVVAVAVIGSLTVLPAVVAGLGDKLDKGRLPFLGRRQAAGPRVPHVGRADRPRHASPGRRHRRSPAARSSRSPSPRWACRPSSRASSPRPSPSRSSRRT